jgi:hypothetical protein
VVEMFAAAAEVVVAVAVAVAAMWAMATPAAIAT